MYENPVGLTCKLADNDKMSLELHCLKKSE